MADADFMLALKNDPQTRQFAIVSHDEIKKEAHYEWLEKNIEHFQVAETNAGVRIGAIRIQDSEISIWIDKEYRSKGIGCMLIKRVAFKNMTAKIVDGNVASMRAFICAGFKPCLHVDNYYVLIYA